MLKLRLFQMILYRLNIRSVTINKKQLSTLRRLSCVLLKVRCWCEAAGIRGEFLAIEMTASKAIVAVQLFVN